MRPHWGSLVDAYGARIVSIVRIFTGVVEKNDKPIDRGDLHKTGSLFAPHYASPIHA